MSHYTASLHHIYLPIANWTSFLVRLLFVRNICRYTNVFWLIDWTRHGGGMSTSRVIRRLHVCSAADTVTDLWQKFHGSWSAAMKQPADWDPTARHYFWILSAATKGVFVHLVCGALWLVCLNCTGYKHPYSLTHSPWLSVCLSLCLSVRRDHKHYPCVCLSVCLSVCPYGTLTNIARVFVCHEY